MTARPLEALVVAHGSPSAPDAPERQLASIGARIAAQLPGWRIATATLGAKGSLGRALRSLENPLVYPFFMSGGWFTNVHLPARLRAEGHDGARLLAPLGLDRQLPRLIADRARDAARGDGVEPGELSLLIAAHGSRTSRESAAAAEDIAAALRRRGEFAEIRAAYIEESPLLGQSGPHPEKSLCLPFFALSASHVTEDVPQSLAQSGFRGRILPPLGSDAAVADIVAAALDQAARTAADRPGGASEAGTATGTGG